MPLLFCFTGTLSTGVELMWEGSLRCRRFMRTTHKFEAFEMSSMDSLFSSSISCCLLDVSVGVSHYLCFMISPVVYLCSYFFKGPYSQTTSKVLHPFGVQDTYDTLFGRLICITCHADHTSCRRTDRRVNILLFLSLFRSPRLFCDAVSAESVLR